MRRTQWAVFRAFPMPSGRPPAVPKTSWHGQTHGNGRHDWRGPRLLARPQRVRCAICGRPRPEATAKGSATGLCVSCAANCYRRRLSDSRQHADKNDIPEVRAGRARGWRCPTLSHRPPILTVEGCSSHLEHAWARLIAGHDKLAAAELAATLVLASHGTTRSSELTLALLRVLAHAGVSRLVRTSLVSEAAAPTREGDHLVEVPGRTPNRPRGLLCGLCGAALRPAGGVLGAWGAWGAICHKCVARVAEHARLRPRARRPWSLSKAALRASGARCQEMSLAAFAWRAARDRQMVQIVRAMARRLSGNHRARWRSELELAVASARERRWRGCIRWFVRWALDESYRVCGRVGSTRGLLNAVLDAT